MKPAKSCKSAVSLSDSSLQLSISYTSGKEIAEGDMITEVVGYEAKENAERKSDSRERRSP